jgi:hypothetical protein
MPDEIRCLRPAVWCDHGALDSRQPTLVGKQLSDRPPAVPVPKARSMRVPESFFLANVKLDGRRGSRLDGTIFNLVSIPLSIQAVFKFPSDRACRCSAAGGKASPPPQPSELHSSHPVTTLNMAKIEALPFEPLANI